MVRVGFGYLPLLFLVLIALTIWLVITLNEIKGYLREIRDLLRQNNRF